jgi:glutamate-5-semialdehyde dehydrogenase
MPVIKHYDGVCHVYVHADADLDMAADIIVNAKCQKPGVCNALETILVHRDIAATFYPLIGKRLAEAKVEVRGDAAALQHLGVPPKPPPRRTGPPNTSTSSSPSKTVIGMEEAIAHINRYGSHHTDSIITTDRATAERFQHEVDSAVVLHNASTRFNDGGEFGFGAEIGISTDKLHARGPMGLRELTSYQYRVRGNGQLRK